MDIAAIFRAFGLTIGQIGDPKFFRVLLIGITLAFLLLVGFGAGFLWIGNQLMGEEVWVPVLGEVRWLKDLFSWGAGLLLGLLSMFLMIPVASAITSLFLDDVADAVEARHYPTLPQNPRTPFAEALTDTLSFLGVLIVVNLLAIIAYVIFAPIALFIFWAVNGFLLGREYFTLAAMRRVGRVKAKVLFRRNLLTIWAAGFLMAIPLSIPMINLIIPILGAATFTHLFHMIGWRDSPPQMPQYHQH